MAYVKTGGKIVKRYYKKYCKLAEELAVEPVEFHSFEVEDCAFLETLIKLKKLTFK
tara:strand:- start:419 stop:586 length:168 start_codon:yes stop_codon:yes gene_type:complete